MLDLLLGAVRVAARQGCRTVRASANGERGSATVEAAIAVCAVVVVLGMALAGSAAVLAQLRCTDAAREAARLVARGEPEHAERAARAVAPTGARIAIRVHGDEAVVEVSAEPAGSLLPGVSVRAEAMAVLEPGVAAAG
jgi:Flp pilus assembly protein TadG